jgi:formate dehydrogenase major subunit
VGPGAERDQRQDARAQEAERSDSVFVVGSSKHNNEQAYLLRKWMSLWGSNNCDHQARICHSTTVAGVANTWGYGAMTNSYNDMRNSKCAMYIGSNAAEAHPGLDAAHAARQGNRLQDDRRRSALHAHGSQGRRVRADPLGLGHRLLFGLVHHIFKNGWEDKKYIADRVYGMDKVRKR